MDTLKGQLVNTKPLMGSTRQAIQPAIRSIVGQTAPKQPNMSVGSNRQSENYAKAMNSAYKATKTFK